MNGHKRRSDRSGREPLPSPGRPPVAGREERRLFWAAIAAGASSEDATASAGVAQAVGARWFRRAGGMPPAMSMPSAGPLSGRHLSFAEREGIALMRAQGRSMREVARRLGRAASTISRELRRNASTRGGGLEYRATTAQWHAERSARRPRPAKLALDPVLRAYVQERLAGMVVAPSGAAMAGPSVPWKGRRHGRRQERRWARAWSPGQIARRLPIDFPDDVTMRISHEAIYQALFIQGRGGLRTRADRLPAQRSSAAGPKGAHARAGQELRHARDHDRRASGGGG
jgi:transposase-like protein